MYKKLDLDLTEYNGPDRNVLPVPGTFVIDTQGIIRAAFAETDYKTRMQPADILAEVQALSRSAGEPEVLSEAR